MKTSLKQLITPAVFIFSFFTALNTNSTPAENGALNQKEKSLVAISSYTAQGKTEKLKTAINDGLDAGLTLNEINEAIVQLYAYCGFPRSLTGIFTFMGVVNERKEKGINDEQGKEIKLKDVEDRYEQGRKVLEELTGRPQSKPAPGFGEFSPRIDAFLKEHLFADIFGSDVLSYHQRELVTIAALASMQGVEPQLGAHLGMGMNVGVSVDELEDLFAVIETSVGIKEAENGHKLLQSILKNRNN